MLFNTICWILIGICCFYLLRNSWAGLLYRVTAMNIKATIKITSNYSKTYTVEDLMPRRNYYLFVLNPLWWQITDVFRDKDVRKQIRERVKNLRKLQ